MTQASAASDLMGKTSALVNSLMAQIQGRFDGNAQTQNLFSNLLAQSDSAQTMVELPDAAATATATSPTSPSSATTTNSSSTSDSSTVEGDASPSSAQDLVQSLDRVAALLRKTIAALHQKNTHNTASAKKTSTTPTATSDASAGSPGTPEGANTTASAASNALPQDATVHVAGADPTASTSSVSSPAVDSSTSGTTPTLSDVLTELLAMTQMAIHQVQAQLTSGGTATTPVANKSSNPVDILSGLAASASGTPPAADITTDQTANSTDLSSGDPLVQMLQEIEKAALKSQAAQTDTVASATVVASPSSQIQAVLAPQTAVFSALDAKLKNVLTALRPQGKKTASDVTAPVDDSVATNQNNAMPTVDKVTGGKPVDPAASPISFTAAPSVPVSTTSNQPAIVSTFSAIAGGNNKATNTDSDTGGDLMSGGGNTAHGFVAQDAAGLGGSLTAENAQAKGTYSFASTLSATRAANGGTTGLPSVVDQVILQLNRSVKSGNDQISLQLHPADLGKITVKLDMTGDGKVQGTVIADNPKTLDVLQKDHRTLERALQDAGLQTDPGSLQFSLGGQGQNNNTAQANQNNQNGTGDGTDSASEDISGGSTLAGAEAATAETYYVTPGGVNIRV